MEDYLRLGLLLVAALIIFLILFEGYFKRRLIKSVDKSTSLTPDEVLGLDPREPKLNSNNIALNDTPEIVLEADAQLQLDFDKPPVITVSKPLPKDLTSDLLFMSVVAKPGHPFASYDLLQAIASTGMQFGEMNIFHYYLQNGFTRTILFSMASATEPGEFNLDRMGDYSCKGLTLFTRLREVPDAQHAFELMLKAAEQLADDLDGEIRSDTRVLWSDETLTKYQQKVSEFKHTTYA